MATVNKKAILLSQLRPEFRARVEGRQNAERRMLSLDERHKIMRRLLQEKVDEAVLTEVAKTVGDHSPGEIEAWLEERRKAEQEERIQRYGSLNKYYAELSRFGTSTWALEEEQRTRQLVRLAWHDLLRHIGDQQSLLVTPREMHKLWKTVRSERMRPPATVVAMVTFGPGSGPEAAGLARKLAAEWAGQDLEADEIARRHGATALPDQRVTRAADDPALPWIREFALAAEPGKVSAPIPRPDGSLWVLKAVLKDPGNSYRFGDPAVQRQLRRQLQNQKLYEIQLRQLRRSKDKVGEGRWVEDAFRPGELR